MSLPVLTRVVDESSLTGWHQVMAASNAADFQALPADPVDDIRPALTGLYNSEQVELWVGAVADEPVAAVVLSLPVHDNVSLAKIKLKVHPDHRRRGYGRGTVDAMLDTARDRGRTRVLGEVPTFTRTADPSQGEALAKSVGARPMLVEKRRLLDIGALSASDLAAWHTEALEASTGYSTVAWCDHTPAAHVADMAELLGLMSTDPPQGELVLEPECWDDERYLQRERSIIDRRRIHLVVAAREDVTGQIVGYTDIGVPGGGATVGYQWDTIVRADHRGHRLGLLLKLANLTELGRTLPEVRYLNTWNADDNAHMVAVNERLGYRPMEGWSEWQLDL